MKIVHLISGSITSGASRGAINLHNNLLKEKISSTILTDDKSVNSKIISTNINIIKIIFKKILILLDKSLKLFYYKRKKTSFSPSIFGENLSKIEIIKNADIIHLHWVNNSFLKISEFIKLKDKKIVWTLRDMWSFTGGCHYSLGCNKYKTECGLCPQLGSNSLYDLSTLIFRKKKKAFANCKNLYFVANSKWLEQKARASKLINNKNLFQINNLIDKDNFFYESKKINKKIIITFGCQYVEARYKGFDYFLDSLKYLDKTKFKIYIFGKLWNFDKLNQLNFDYKYLGYINNKTKLRKIYSETDIFISSSTEDAFPKTFAEAMLCRSAVICFEKTSVSKLINHKKNGYIAKFKSGRDIANGIKWLTKTNLKMKKIQVNAEKYSNTFFDPVKLTNEYIKFYKLIK